MESTDLHWAAGFFEGEGCFRSTRAVVAEATQVNREPLERLQRIFGGKILLKKYYIKRPNTQPLWDWYVGSVMAATFAVLLFSELSQKRKNEAEKMLRLWEHGNGRRHGQYNSEKTNCPRGHPYSGDNLQRVLFHGRVHRRCLECKREWNRLYERRRRARK